MPTKLSTDLVVLRDEPGLMEDVWLSPSPPSSQPLWLDDQNTRRAIRALLKADRCIQERQRLGREADNLRRWFGRRVAAIELALHRPESRS